MICKGNRRIRIVRGFSFVFNVANSLIFASLRFSSFLLLLPIRLALGGGQPDSFKMTNSYDFLVGLSAEFGQQPDRSHRNRDR